MRNSKNKLKNKNIKENYFLPDEIVDIVNEKEKQSYEGKIITMKGDLIIVQNMKNGNTEAYNIDEGKVLKTWNSSRLLQKYNRVDFDLNNNNYYVEATVININRNTNEITLKYKNNNRYKPIGESTVNIDSKRIFPVGIFTRDDQYNDKENNYLDTNSSEEYKNNSLLGEKTKNQNTKNIFVVLKDEQELEFKNSLKKVNLEIIKVSGDGNCLFRAISHQVYGTDKYHGIIRKKCMDYIEIQKRFFKEFIYGDFDEYIKKKRKDGTWGDDIELEAISEIYNRPIEIYSGNEKPLKCFHEENQYSTTPIRLSYHGKKHYNSIIPLEEANYKYQTYKNSLIKTEPGKFEDKSISIAKNNENSFEKCINLSEEEYYERLKKNLSGKKNEEILDNKIQELNKSHKNINIQINEEEAKNKKLKIENQNKKNGKKKDEKGKEEKENQTKEKEKEESKKREKKEKEEKKEKKEEKKEDKEKKEEKKEDKEKDNSKIIDDLDPIIKKILELGYDYDEAVEAFLLYGNDQELAVNYLITKHS